MPTLHTALPRLAPATVVAFALAFGSVAAAVPAPPDLPAQLTLEDALRIFRAHGLDLIVAEAAVRGAEGDVRAAGAVPNPSVGVSYGYVFTYNPDDPSCAESNATCTPHSIGASLSDQGAVSDVVSGRRGLRLRVARLALDAARQTRADAQRTLEFQVKQQYIQAALARDQLDLALAAQAKATQILDLHQVRYRAGAISEAEVAKVEVAKLDSDQAVAAARQALEVARLGLALLLGVRGQVPRFEVAADLPRYAVPAPLVSATRESLLAEALGRRPDLKALAHQRDRAAAAVSLARRQNVPGFQLGANYQQAGTGGAGTNAPLTPPTLTAGLTVTPPLFYQQQGDIRRAQADLLSQGAQLARIEAQVLNDVATAHARFSATKERVERMQARLLERATRARDLIAIQYQKGAASLLEFLDAERTYIGINQEYLQNLADYWTAVFQLEQATGADLRR